MNKKLSAHVVFSVLFTVGLFAAAPVHAANDICKNLPTLSKRKPTAKEIKKCRQHVNGRVFDYNALMICKNMNTISSNGASARDINACLGQIADRQFNSTKVKQCSRGHRSSKRLITCLRASSV